MIAEPDVTLTDYGLAVLSVGLAWALPRGPRGSPARAWRAFFGAVAVAAAVGGTVHGFFPDPASGPGRVLWQVTLLAIGATALAAWWIAAGMLSTGWGGAVRLAAALALVVYAAAVVAVSDDFRVAIVCYVPATVFLLGVLARAAWRGRDGAAVAALGLVVLLAGSWIQWQGIGLAALRLTHNALYHVVEAVALLLLCLGARRLLAPSGATPTPVVRGR